MASALSGLRVIEMAQGIAGPYTSMLLAKQGAEVIKIKPPCGDHTRGTPGFHVWNRSKRSVVADPTTAEGHAFIRHLAATADVFLTDAQPGSTEVPSYSSLAEDNPRLVFCHLPTFGGTGTQAHRYPDDSLVAAVSGLLGSQWSHRDGGVHLMIPIASYGAAFVACGAVTAALYERGYSGRGQHVEVSWLAGAFAMQTGAVLYHPELLRLFSGRLNPLGPMMLAQLGATVIKVESLQGDAFRSFGFGFLGWNQGKRGLAVNLTSPEGREVVYDLLRKADVVVENLRPGATARYGIDSPAPRLVQRRTHRRQRVTGDAHAPAVGGGAANRNSGQVLTDPNDDPVRRPLVGATHKRGAR